MSLPTITAQNFSLYAIPASLFLAYVPHVIKHAIILRATGKHNNISPRTTLDALKGRVPAATLDMATRANAAHANGMEVFPAFATAIILAHVSSLPVSTINNCAGIFLAVRFLYNFVYIANTNRVTAAFRSTLWGIGIGSCFTLMFKAAAAVGLKSAALKL
ncbi:hypothetical protein HDU86_003130 [Geranomyces michiganensis]|nr:hypothetical protein HDU86_003130 [Geranomyces michiganensis]